MVGDVCEMTAGGLNREDIGWAARNNRGIQAGEG